LTKEKAKKEDETVATTNNLLLREIGEGTCVKRQDNDNKMRHFPSQGTYSLYS
jgi:hypothetical protein